jgi:hypothetical protein
MFSRSELCEDCNSGGNSGDKEGGDKHDPDLVPNKKPTLLMKLLYHSFTCTALMSVMNRTP